MRARRPALRRRPMQVVCGLESEIRIHAAVAAGPRAPSGYLTFQRSLSGCERAVKPAPDQGDDPVSPFPVCCQTPPLHRCTPCAVETCRATKRSSRSLAKPIHINGTSAVRLRRRGVEVKPPDMSCCSARQDRAHLGSLAGRRSGGPAEAAAAGSRNLKRSGEEGEARLHGNGRIAPVEPGVVRCESIVAFSMPTRCVSGARRFTGSGTQNPLILAIAAPAS